MRGFPSRGIELRHLRRCSRPRRKPLPEYLASALTVKNEFLQFLGVPVCERGGGRIVQDAVVPGSNRRNLPSASSASGLPADSSTTSSPKRIGLEPSAL